MPNSLNQRQSLLKAIRDVQVHKSVSSMPNAFKRAVDAIMMSQNEIKHLDVRITRLTKAMEHMDKKIHKITERMALAEKDIKANKPKAAKAVLKGASKDNEKLVKIDKTQRDPVIDAVESKLKCKGAKCVKKIKAVK